jgi:hypothetical protein
MPRGVPFRETPLGGGFGCYLIPAACRSRSFMLGGPCRSAREPCVWSGLGPLGVRSFARSAASFSSSSSVAPWRRWMCSAGMPALRATRCRRDSRWSSSSCLVASVACFCAFWSSVRSRSSKSLRRFSRACRCRRSRARSARTASLSPLRVFGSPWSPLARLRGSWGFLGGVLGRRRGVVGRGGGVLLGHGWVLRLGVVARPASRGREQVRPRPGSAQDVAVRDQEAHGLLAVAREALDGAHREPLAAL